MKRLLTIILVLLVATTLVACSPETTQTEQPAVEQAEEPAEEPKEEPKEEPVAEEPKEEPAEEPAEESSDTKIELGKPITLGDYEVTVQKFEVVKDWEDKDVLKITYDWKNNSDKDQSAIFAVNFKAFQDGIENGVEMILSDFIDLGIGQKDVRAGYGQEGVETGIMIDTTKPIEIELSELISFGGNKYTIVLEPGDY